MPHKHKRKRDEDDSNFNLPPTSRARTLTVHQKQESIFTSDADKKSNQEARKQQRKKKKKNNNNNNGADFEDDTPKAFRRLMSFQPGGKRIPSGLDDGNISKKKRKETTTPKPSLASKPDASGNHAAAAAVAPPIEPSDPPSTATAAPNIPKILPGESLASYSQRVDQSLPLTSIPKHRTRLSAIPGLEKIKAPLTKHNKRLARMQKEWRATDQRLKEKREEEDEELAEREEEDEILWLGAGVDPSLQISTLSKSGKKKATTTKKKKRKGGGRDVDDADPWKILEKKRREEGQLVRQTNLQDVVAAPPTLKPVKNIFKDKTERNDGMVSVR